MNQAFQDVESFVDRLPVGVIILDADLQVKTCNDLALFLLNIGIENCLTGSFIDALIDQQLKEILVSIHKGKTEQQYHLALESPGRTITCTINAVINDIGGNEIVIIVQDATHLRDLERLKREFISSLLHKIRNPLSTLKTSLAILQDDKMGHLPPDVQEILGMGYHEVNRLSVLLNDMRDLFLIETGLARRDLVIEKFSVVNVLERAVTRLAKMEPPLNMVQQRLVFSGNLEVSIAADFEKTKRIFTDLLSNALLYSASKTPILLTCTDTPDSVTIMVKDYGPGIANDKLPLVFSKYFREDVPGASNSDGNGLGLFIAKAFAECMGGTMYCESEQDKGSSFFCTLPSGK